MVSDWRKRREEAEERSTSRIQHPENFEDLDLLVGGEDVLYVKRTDHPDCASEDFLFISKGKNNLILWGTGLGSRVNEIYGRVIKLPLNKISFGQPLGVPDYECNKFFELNEKTFTKLHDAGLIY